MYTHTHTHTLCRIYTVGNTAATICRLDVLPSQGKLPLLPRRFPHARCITTCMHITTVLQITTAPPSSLPPPHFSVPPPGPIRTSTSAGHDVANAMAAMLGGFRPPDHPFPNFLPPPAFPPPFHPHIPGSDFRPRVPPFHGGPPPFSLLPGGPLDVPGMLPPHLEDRGLPMHPDLGLPGTVWDVNFSFLSLKFLFSGGFRCLLGPLHGTPIQRAV